jgi:hypothetical protein
MDDSRRFLIRLVRDIAVTFGKRGYVAKVFRFPAAGTEYLSATTLAGEIDIFD